MKVVEEVAYGFNDLVLGNGRAWGYSYWRFENGDFLYTPSGKNEYSAEAEYWMAK